MKQMSIHSFHFHDVKHPSFFTSMYHLPSLQTDPKQKETDVHRNQRKTPRINCFTVISPACSIHPIKGILTVVLSRNGRKATIQASYASIPVAPDEGNLNAKYCADSRFYTGQSICATNQMQQNFPFFDCKRYIL